MNKDIAEKVFRAVFASPKHHRQSNWVRVPEVESGKNLHVDYDEMVGGNICGTTACLAGWATLAAGYRIDAEMDDYGQTHLTLKDSNNDFVTSGVVDLPLLGLGQNALGLDEDTANTIFYTMDERVAIAMLYSMYETDDIYALQDRLVEEIRAKDNYVEGEEYDVDLDQMAYDQAKSKFGPKAKVDA